MMWIFILNHQHHLQPTDRESQDFELGALNSVVPGEAQRFSASAGRDARMSSIYPFDVFTEAGSIRWLKAPQ